MSRHKKQFPILFSNVGNVWRLKYQLFFSNTCRYNTVHVPCGISIQTSPVGLPPGRMGCAHAWSAVPNNEFILPKRGLKCFVAPTNHITGFWTNELAESSVQQPIRIRWLQLRPRPNNIYSDIIVIGILGFLTDHDDVHLWEMRQRIYREEQPNQISKDPCRFFTDLFLWDMRQMTTKRGMKRPTAIAWPAIYVISISTDWTS